MHSWPVKVADFSHVFVLGWGATFVKVATLFGVTWMLLVIAVTGVVPMSTNNVCKAFSLGFRGKGSYVPSYVTKLYEYDRHLCIYMISYELHISMLL